MNTGKHGAARSLVAVDCSSRCATRGGSTGHPLRVKCTGTTFFPLLLFAPSLFLRPYYTMRRFTYVFIVLTIFHFDSRFGFWIFASENARKTREKSKTRAKREKMFLYYTMRWVTTRASCVFLAFYSRFARVFVHKRKPKA